MERSPEVWPDSKVLDTLFSQPSFNRLFTKFTFGWVLATEVSSYFGIILSSVVYIIFRFNIINESLIAFSDIKSENHPQKNFWKVNLLCTIIFI